MLNHFKRTTISKPEQWLIEAAASIGLDFSKFTHETTNELVSHSMKRHGNPDTQGAVAVTEADFEHIPAIIEAPDFAVIGALRKGLVINAYAKKDGSTTYLYFEEVLQGRKNKALRGERKNIRFLCPIIFTMAFGKNGEKSCFMP